MYFNLSVVIPVLNEEKNIKKLCFKLVKYLKNIKYEIIIVDDGSEDGTGSAINKISNKKIYSILRKNKQKDLAQSCALGIKKSKYENVLIMDGDLQHNPKYIPQFVKLFKKQKLDFVVGVRDFSKRKNLGIIRFYASKLIIFFFNLFLGFKTRDPMSGFFLFKKKIYYENKEKLFNKGYKILADLLYNSKRKLIIRDCKIIFNLRLKNKSKMNIKVLILIIQFFFIKLFE